MTKEEVIESLEAILEEVTESEDAVCYVTSVDAPALNAAVEALKNSERIAESAQNVQNDDLISRKAAIALVATEKPQLLDSDALYMAINELPPVQPELAQNLHNACEDLISRQDAIDVVADALKGVFVEYQDIAEKLIGKLPSAQPEIIHCAECKYQDKGSNEPNSWNLCGYRPWIYVPTSDEHYCGYAERKIDG